jgi:hypothetical protein
MYMQPRGVPTKITVCMYEYVTTQEFIDGLQQNLIQVLKNSTKKNVQPFQFSVTMESFNECYT